MSATQGDLDNTIQSLLTVVGSLTTEVQAAFARLDAKISAGVDFTPEINNLNQAIASLQTIIDQAKTQGV